MVLEDECFLLGARPIFRGVLMSFREEIDGFQHQTYLLFECEVFPRLFLKIPRETPTYPWSIPRWIPKSPNEGNSFINVGGLGCVPGVSWKILWKIGWESNRLNLGGCFKHFEFLPGYMGKWITIWRAYVSHGLVQARTFIKRIHKYIQCINLFKHQFLFSTLES